MSTLFPWEISAFDTDALGFRTARISYERSAAKREVTYRDVGELTNELVKNGVTYATCRVSAADYGVLQILETHGFVIVDGIVSFGKNIGIHDVYQGRSVRPALPEYHEALVELAGPLFRGISRYYHDSIIPEGAADLIYRQWMRNSIGGSVADAVLVFLDDTDLLGFVTVQKKGVVPLIGVASHARGKGVGMELMRAAAAQCREWGLEHLSVDTQLSNIPALRLYESCGFNIEASFITLRWYSANQENEES